MINFRMALAALASTCMWGLVFALVAVPHAGGSAAPSTVGVVEFYAQSPVPVFAGVVPESFAADDLSRLLARSTTGRLTIIPAATMRRAEGDLHWRSDDVLHFDRLRALANAVGADRLVVGWIPLFNVGAGGGSAVPFSDDGSEMPTADVNIVVQVFDAAAGRLTGETRQAGFALGITFWQVATRALHTALDRSIPELLRLLGAQAS
jgi:hypothetical protein